MNNIKRNQFVAQLKRELIEYKFGMIYLPLILSGLLTLFFVGLAYYFIFFREKMPESETTLNGVVLEFMYANCAIMLVVYTFVLINYLLNSLYDDRKNKQILFWRSMPVSETVNVLMKVFVVAVVAPTLLLCINQLVTILVAILGSIFLIVIGSASHIVFPVGEANAFIIPLEIYMDNLLGMLFMLPLIGYFLFVSAISKRFPMAIAFGVPVLLVLIDFMLGRINLTIGVISLLHIYKDMLVDIKSAFVLKEVFELQSDFIRHLLFSFGIGGLFIAASIWLRNHRYEI